MGSYIPRLSQELAVVACIDPDAYTTGTQTSDIIDMRYHKRVMFIVQVGDFGTNGTCSFTVFGDSAAAMGTEVALTGKSITQLTDAGTDDDKQAIVEVTAEELASQIVGGRYVRGKLVIGTATSDAGMIALADRLRYAPASVYDLASVDEIVA
jgi:hypothetical protein